MIVSHDSYLSTECENNCFDTESCVIMDAGPYDNVEFPIRQGSQTWSGPQTSTKLYGYNVSARDRVTGTPTLETVAESEGNDYSDERADVEEQRQLITPAGTSPHGGKTGIQTHGFQTSSSTEFHTSPVIFQTTGQEDKKVNT